MSSELITLFSNGYTSRFETFSAFSSINSRLGATSSPISVANASIAKSILVSSTLTSVSYTHLTLPTKA